MNSQLKKFKVLYRFQELIADGTSTLSDYSDRKVVLEGKICVTKI
ncbi:hypothetical protein [Moorena sp. SIO3H5]|nr:hypothetical protein [Moorena sp. SIO3H5]